MPAITAFAMNISEKFSRIKEAFSKVRTDIDYLSRKMSENYESFMREHYELSKNVEGLKDEFRKLGEEFKAKTLSAKEHNDIRHELKELREIVENSHSSHASMARILDELKQDRKSVRELKTKLETSELEIFLLKEKMDQKDEEIKQLKEVGMHLFSIVEEIAAMEKRIAKGIKAKH